MTSTKKTTKLNYKHRCDLKTCNVQCVTKFLNPKTGYCQNPYPLSKGCSANIKYDSVFELVRKKQNHQLKIESMKNTCRKYQYKMRIDKQFYCYQNMQNFLAKDPDKYFCSNYNWYYTNGNLVIQNIDNAPILFFTTNLTNLSAIEINRKHTDWVMKKKYDLFHGNSVIYQLDCVNVVPKTFLGVRREKDISIYDIKMNDDKQVNSKLVSSQSANIPFVAMSLNKHNVEEYVTVNVNQMITCYDLCKETKIYEYVIPYNIDDLQGDCFAQIVYFNNNVLMYINRTTLFILDKRSNRICCKIHIKYNDILELYDRFVNICPCQANTFYISTFRDVLLFDLRLKHVLNKYTHNFSSAPLITDVMNNTNHSVFCISSSKPNEKIILEKEGHSNLIPVSVPTIANSYESSLLHSTNLSLSLNIKQRLETSTTGIRLWSDENNTSFGVFSTNILGDVFSYEIYKTKKIYNNHLNHWNELFYDKYKNNELNFVDKIVLNDIQFDYNSKPVMNVLKNKHILECTEDLQNIKKGYNTKICNVWENVINKKVNILDDIEEIPTNVNVQNWLSQYCS